MPQLVFLTVFFAALLALGGCSSEPEPGPEPQKTYRHSMDGTPTGLDPAHASNVYAGFLVVNLFDTLYRYRYLARPYEITENLAAGPPVVSADGLTYTITLKQGVRFQHDPAFDQGVGREVSAEDLVYSLKRHFDPEVRSRGSWLWRDRIQGMAEWQAQGSDYDQPVTGLRALDRYTVEVRLTRPFPQFVYTLTTAHSALVPREVVEARGREFGTAPVGSGPFRLISMDTTRAELERNPEYRREKIDLAAEGFDPLRHAGLGLESVDGREMPLVDRAVVDFVVDGASGWVSFTAGNEIQYVRLPPDLFDQALASRSPPRLKPDLEQQYHLHVTPEFGVTQIVFNLDDPGIGYQPDPEANLRNRDLRCALRKAFDWDQRNQVFYGGIAQIYPGVIPPAVPEFDPDADRSSVTHDPEGARQILQRLGSAENLPVLEYTYNSGVAQQRGFEQFRGQMSAVGYPDDKITRRVFATFPDVSRAASNRELQIWVYGWTMDYPDAENVLALFYGPNRAPGNNVTNYANPEYDRLFEQAAAMQPSPERTAIYRQLNQMLIDDCVSIAGVTRVRAYLTHRDVIGVPDRELVGGYFLRFVDVVETP